MKDEGQVCFNVIKLVRVFQVQFVEASTHTKKEWYRIGMFRALVDEMYA